MLFNLLLATIRILLYFFFSFLVSYFISTFIFFIIPLVKEKIKEKLSRANPTGASTILTEEIMHTPPLVALRTIKTLSM